MKARPVSLLLWASIAWTTAVILAPLMHLPAIYAAASAVCHQLPQRSFHLADAPIAVCARCLGLYIGGIAGLLAGGRFGPVAHARPRLATPAARAVVAAGALPTAITLIVEWLWAWPVGNTIRFGAALPLGAAAAFVIANALERDL